MTVVCFARILNFDIPDLTDGAEERIGTQSVVPAPARRVAAPYGVNCDISRRGGYQPPDIGTQSVVPAPARPVVAPYGEGAFHIRRARRLGVPSAKRQTVQTNKLVRTP